MSPPDLISATICFVWVKYIDLVSLVPIADKLSTASAGELKAKAMTLFAEADALALAGARAPLGSMAQHDVTSLRWSDDPR